MCIRGLLWRPRPDNVITAFSYTAEMLIVLCVLVPKTAIIIDMVKLDAHITGIVSMLRWTVYQHRNAGGLEDYPQH